MSKYLKKNTYESIRDAASDTINRNNQKNKPTQNHTSLDHHEDFIKTIVPFPTPTFWVTLIGTSSLLVLISGSILFGGSKNVGKNALDFAAGGTSLTVGLFGIASVILLKFYSRIKSDWLTKQAPPKEFQRPDGKFRLFLAVPYGVVMVFALFSLAIACTGKGESELHVVCCVLEILFINALIFHWLMELGYIPLDAPSHTNTNQTISTRTPEKPDSDTKSLLQDPEAPTDTSVSNDNAPQQTTSAKQVEDKDFTVKIPREHLLQRCIVFTEIVLCSWILTFYCAFTKQVSSGTGFVHSIFGTILAYYVWKKIFPVHWYDQEPDRNESTCYGRSGTSRVLYGLYSFFCIILVLQLGLTTFLLLSVSSQVDGVSVSPLAGVLLFIMFYGYWKVATLPRTKFDYTNEIATIDTWFFVKSGTGNESHHRTEEKLMYVAVVPLFVFFGLVFDGFAQVMLTSHRLIILKREAGFYGQEQVLSVHELEDLDSIRVEYGYPWCSGLYSCNPPCCVPPLLASGKNVLDVSVPIPEAYQDQLLAVISTQINALRFRQRHAALSGQYRQ